VYESIKESKTQIKKQRETKLQLAAFFKAILHSYYRARISKKDKAFPPESAYPPQHLPVKYATSLSTCHTERRTTKK
jgi:hypothetical protein